MWPLLSVGLRSQTPGLETHRDPLRELQSHDVNIAVNASKKLLAVAEATQVPVVIPHTVHYISACNVPELSYLLSEH